MSALTTYPRHRALVTDKQLAAALKRRDRARRLDRLSFQYRHATRILSGLGVTVILVTVAETTLKMIGA